MYAELYRYLILNKQLLLPGIGAFEAERRPASGDFVNRQMMASSYVFNLLPGAGQPTTKFFKWLGNALAVPDREAIIRFNDFLFQVKQQISNGDTIEWNGVGRLNKGLAGEIKFSPSAPASFEAPVTAEKVIRQKAEHTVRVGEDEKTAAEMTEMLGGAVVKKSYWWVAPLIIALLAAAFIGWYVYNNGFDVTGFANTTSLNPQETQEGSQSN